MQPQGGAKNFSGMILESRAMFASGKWVIPIHFSYRLPELGDTTDRVAEVTGLVR